MALYHGSRKPLTFHIGLCLTDDDDAAIAYSGDGYLTEVAVDFDGLTVIEVASYDRDANTAPGDDDDSHGADVLVFDDEDTNGQPHRTWRLMSDAAVVAASSGKVRHIESEEAIEGLVDFWDFDAAIEEGELDGETLEELEKLGLVWRLPGRGTRVLCRSDVVAAARAHRKVWSLP